MGEGKYSLTNTIFILFLNLLILLFLAANFNFEVAMYYAVFGLVVGMGYLSDPDKKNNIPFKRKDGIVQPLVIAGFGLGIFFLVMSIITGFGFSTQSIASISTLWFASAPVLSGVASINMFLYVVIIPIIETVGLLIIFEAIAHRLKIPLRLDLKNPSQIGLIIGMGLGFMALHFGTRGLTNTTGLVITFVFGMIMVVMSLLARTRQSLEATMMHGANNGVAIWMMAAAAV